MTTEGTKLVTYQGENVHVAGVAIPVALLLSMLETAVNGRGIVLGNERVKIMLINPQHGVPLEYAVSVSVQRSGWGEDEMTRIATVAKERKDTKSAKEREAADLLAREKQSAVKIGQDSILSAMRNVNELAQAARTIGHLANS